MRNWKDNKYAERLIKEWLDYGKIIVGADFDDTLNPWKFTTEEDKKIMANVAATLRFAQKIGIYLSIWTACSEERFNEIKEICNKLGLSIDSINENPITLPYGNHRKMYYNILIDDRAGLEESIDMLEYCAFRVQTDRKPTMLNFDV